MNNKKRKDCDSMKYRYKLSKVIEEFINDCVLEEINIGCNASFLRVHKPELADTSLLPEDADGITLFANPRSKVRDHMTVCYSFDGGKTWAGLKEIYAGPSGYSSLTFSVPEQKFYLV